VVEEEKKKNGREEEERGSYTMRTLLLRKAPQVNM
jgi:hypothetical protein